MLHDTVHEPPRFLRPQDPQLLLARNGGKPPLTMQAFTKLADAGGQAVSVRCVSALRVAGLLCSVCCWASRNA